MRRRVAAVAGVLAVVAAGAVTASGGGEEPAPATAREPAPATAQVTRGRLAAAVSLSGILTYRARPDGSPFAVVNRAAGVYTELPESGDRVGCGEVLHRVDDEPVLLLCGTVPAYRDLRPGDQGRDVRQLNRNLRALGFGARPGRTFTARTARALAALARRRGLERTGRLRARDVVVLPQPVRIAEVRAQPGGAARPGATVAEATSATPGVQVELDAAQQGEVRRGDRARITLPAGTQADGVVERLGRVARTPSGDDAGGATIPAFIRLDDPAQARGLDRAPVQVEIATEGVDDALSVPVTALVGRSGGGFAVEVVRAGGRRELVQVRLGLFDTAAGRVAVAGALREGDAVVVPAP